MSNQLFQRVERKRRELHDNTAFNRMKDYINYLDYAEPKRELYTGTRLLRGKSRAYNITHRAVNIMLENPMFIWDNDEQKSDETIENWRERNEKKPMAYEEAYESADDTSGDTSWCNIL